MCSDSGDAHRHRLSGVCTLRDSHPCSRGNGNRLRVRSLTRDSDTRTRDDTEGAISVFPEAFCAWGMGQLRDGCEVSLARPNIERIDGSVGQGHEELAFCSDRIGNFLHRQWAVERIDLDSSHSTIVELIRVERDGAWVLWT